MWLNVQIKENRKLINTDKVSIISEVENKEGVLLYIDGKWVQCADLSFDSIVRAIELEENHKLYEQRYIVNKGVTRLCYH